MMNDACVMEAELNMCGRASVRKSLDDKHMILMIMCRVVEAQALALMQSAARIRAHDSQ